MTGRTEILTKFTMKLIDKLECWCISLIFWSFVRIDRQPFDSDKTVKIEIHSLICTTNIKCFQCHLLNNILHGIDLFDVQLDSHFVSLCVLFLTMHYLSKFSFKFNKINWLMVVLFVRLNKFTIICFKCFL